MNTKEFDSLPVEEKVNVANARMAEIVEQGLTVKDFKNEQYDFSHSFVISRIKEEGYAYCSDERRYVLKQNAKRVQTKTNSSAKEGTPRIEENVMNQTSQMPDDLDWDLLKQMMIAFQAQQLGEGEQSFEPLLKQMMGQETRSTSFKLRGGILDDWSAYVKEWSYVTSIDLTSAALLHFMKSFPLPTNQSK